MVLTDKLTAIADAIRGKTGGTKKMTLDEMPTAIEGIGSGGSGGGVVNDGKTRLYIHLQDGRTSPRVGLYINGKVTVDWGDGSDTVTLTGNSLITCVYTDNHAYASPGDYVITLTVVEGELRFSGSSNRACVLSGTTSVTDNVNQIYRNSLQRVEIGSGVKNILCGFASCNALNTAIISNGVDAMGNAFQGCYSLRNVTIPDSVTSINSATSGNAFRDCTSLTAVVLPGSITEIKSYSFYNCYGVAYYDFTAHSTVPVLANTNAFTGIAADCEIRVPSALYESWITASNWSTYADYIVGV